MGFLLPINYVAVVVASVVSFIIGLVWFSGLFGSIWAEELKNHNVEIKEPSQSELAIKMLLTFAANLITSIALAYIVSLTGSTSVLSGVTLGVLAAIGLAGTTLSSVFVWESRSIKLFLIDFGYPALSIIASAIILSVWH